MAIKLDKGRLAINQVISNRREMVNAVGDCIVPDVKPDILEVVSTSGVVNVYKKEVMDGKVRIDGCVNVYVMYLGAEDGTRGVRSINHTIDFSQSFNVPDATTDMNESGEVFLQRIDCKIINERKISLNAELVFDIKLLSNSSVEYVNNVDVKDIQKLEKTMQVDSVLGVGNTKTSVKETVNIDSADNLAEILKVNANICNKNIKISYNKILTKADIRFKMMYSTEDGRINVVETKFPVMGFVDMPDITEENSCDYEFEIRNMIIKPNSTQEHSIYVEIEIGINVTAYQKKDVNMIEDLYSPCANLNFEKSDINVMTNKSRFNKTFTINQKEFLDIGDEKVYDVDTSISINDINVNDNEVNISGNARLIFTHSNQTASNIANKVLDIPFENRVNCPGLNRNSNVEVTANIMSQDFNIMPGGEVQINIDMEFDINSVENVNMSLISNVEEAENMATNDYNMVIYKVVPNDTLWNIAKKFGSTVKSIMDTNDLTSDLIMPGTKLFIEKYMGANG